MKQELKRYDILYVTGNRQLLNLIRGLLICNGQLLDSYQLPNYTRPMYHIGIKLPEDKVQHFELFTRLKVNVPLIPRR